MSTTTRGAADPRTRAAGYVEECFEQHPLETVAAALAAGALAGFVLGTLVRQQVSPPASSSFAERIGRRVMATLADHDPRRMLH